MNCESIQRQIEEHLAVGIPADLLPGTLRSHLHECASCAAFVAAGEELSRLLEEPLPLPPPDLTERILGAVALGQSRPQPVSRGEPLVSRGESLGSSVSLTHAERLIWAALGAVSAWGLREVVAGATLGLQSLWQSASLALADWTASLEALSLPTLAAPAVDATFGLATAVGLMGLQLVILWRTRRQEVGR